MDAIICAKQLLLDKHFQDLLCVAVAGCFSHHNYRPTGCPSAAFSGPHQEEKDEERRCTCTACTGCRASTASTAAQANASRPCGEKRKREIPESEGGDKRPCHLFKCSEQRHADNAGSKEAKGTKGTKKTEEVEPVKEAKEMKEMEEPKETKRTYKKTKKSKRTKKAKEAKDAKEQRPRMPEKEQLQFGNWIRDELPKLVDWNEWKKKPVSALEMVEKLDLLNRQQCHLRIKVPASRIMGRVLTKNFTKTDSGKYDLARPLSPEKEEKREAQTASDVRRTIVST